MRRIMNKGGFWISILLFLNLFLSTKSYPQFRNNTWLIGNQWLFSVPKSQMIFSDTSYTLSTEYRKMPFEGTNASIGDENGNFLMSSNGVWIANANHDTMLNGNGLNPSWDVNAHTHGLLNSGGNIILPFPGDTTKYILIHEAYFDNAFNFSYGGGVHKSIIDITGDAGLGEVIEKNDTLINDKLTMGVAACRHANGRDWWVIAQKDSSDVLYKILLTPNGVDTIITQSLGYTQFFFGNSSFITFSKDGKKFIQSNYHYVAGNQHPSYVILADFDRCTGMFSNTQTIQLTQDSYLFGLAFSPSGEYAYACTSLNVFQINTNTFSVDTIATYDGFCFPNNPWCTTFWNMYLAANGKIYITSGSGVKHIHEMNYPDSAGPACDLQQHAIYLNGVWSFRAVPNHPNYNLGCDTTSGCSCLTAIEDLKKYDFRFSVSPNPVANGQLKIVYLLPQNKKGIFEIFDVNGRKVFTKPLPQWSTLQNVLLPDLGNGIYNCVITSGELRVSKKVVVMK